jgi:DNA repair ATPase RecN
VGKLDKAGRIEELARMLTGAEITDSARRHAKELLKIRSSGSGQQPEQIQES